METSRLSINLATVRQQWNLREAVEACARHGITAVDPGATRSQPLASMSLFASSRTTA
jgi:hypothetical protein